jgi:hypothetical protein
MVLKTERIGKLKRVMRTSSLRWRFLGLSKACTLSHHVFDPLLSP